MRLAIALALFLGVLDVVYSAPTANSEALLQELRNALNEKETSIQQQPTESLAILCAPKATGFARVSTGQTQSLNGMVREQEPVSIGLGVAGLIVGLTGLGLSVADRVEGNEQSKKEAILQETKGLFREKSAGFARVPTVPTGQTQSLNEMVKEQEPISIGLGVAGLLVGLTGLGLQVADRVEGNEQSKKEAILQEITNLLSQEKSTDQKRSASAVNVPLTEMLCAPVKVEHTDKLASGSSFMVRTFQ